MKRNNTNFQFPPFEHPDFIQGIKLLHTIFCQVGQVYQPKGLLITGEIGTGKSTMVAHFLQNVLSAKGILAINMPIRATIKNFIHTLFEKLGKENSDEKGKFSLANLTSRLIYEIKEQEIHLIIIDDFELVLDSNNQKVNQDVLNLLANIQSATNVSIVALGLPICHVLLTQNPKLARRFSIHLNLNSTKEEKDEKEPKELLKEINKQLPNGNSLKLVNNEFQNKKKDIEDTLTHPTTSATKTTNDIITRDSKCAQQNIVKGPLEQAWVDHVLLDVTVIDEKRGVPLGKPVITFIVDEFSGYPLGYHLGFNPPSYESIVHALTHAIKPKGYIKEKYPTIQNQWDSCGIPQKLVIDNGKEFIGNSLKDVCCRLGIVLQCRPRKHPYFKGTVERYFRAINQQLNQKCPKTIHSNMDWSVKPTAGIGFNQLHALIHLWLVDYYAQNFQKGNGGVPSDIWRKAKKDGDFSPLVPCSEMLMECLPVQNATISSFGIRFSHFYYLSKELMKLKEKLSESKYDYKITFRYNLEDLSVIFVYDKFNDSFITVPCTNQEYSKGLHVDVHRNLIKEMQKTKVDKSTLVEIRAKLMQIIEQAKTEHLTSKESNQ